MICMRVCPLWSAHVLLHFKAQVQPYLHKIDWIHNGMFLQSTISPQIFLFATGVVSYRDPSESAREHVVAQAIICWKSFIAVVHVSLQFTTEP